ncbi:MAG: cytochrome bc complex cytochrome b subunit [Nitrospinaceae bacterium]
MMNNPIKNWTTSLYKWVQYRTGVGDLVREQLTEYRLPPRLTKWQTLGGLSLFVFGLQLVTGVLLLLYYVPSTEEAFDSIRRIMLEIPYGWLVRNAHAVGSHLMIVVLLLHMVSVMFMGSYKNPREITWLTGCGLLFLTLGVCFTGYLLPWSQLSYWATTVATSIPEPIPVVGPWIVKLIRGGERINPDTLNRFFALHVVAIPAAMLAFTGIHLYLVRVLGIEDPELPDPRQTPAHKPEPAFSENPASQPQETEREDKYRKPQYKQGMLFYPTFVMGDVLVIFIFMVFFLAGVFFYPDWIVSGDSEIPADPFNTPEHIKPEWYFLAPYQFLKLVPSEIGALILQTVAFLAFVCLPFIDFSKEHNILKRPVFLMIIIFSILFFLGLTIWGAVS